MERNARRSGSVSRVARIRSGRWNGLRLRGPFVRQSTEQSQELIIEITEKRRGGPNLEWRVVLEKQEVKKQQEKK
jgi:hypothetical protein